MTGSSDPIAQLTAEQASDILCTLAEHGTPPRRGVMCFSVGFDPILEELEERYFKNLLPHGKSCLKLVEACYGGGKTHFLYHVQEAALRAGFAVSLIAQAPRETHFAKPLGVYQAVARELLAPGTNDDQRKGIDRMLAQWLDDKRAEIGEGKILEWIRSSGSQMAVESLSYRSAVLAFLKARLEGESASQDRLAAYLRGEPVPMKDLKVFSVYEKMADKNAFLLLRSLCEVVRGLGFGGLVLLIDEMDRLLTHGKANRKMAAIADHLRELVDRVGRHELPGAMFLFAVPPEFWEVDAIKSYQALGERLRSPYPFGPLNPLAPIIKLDELTDDESTLLANVGDRLQRLYERATGRPVEPELSDTLRRLADKCGRSRSDPHNRRIFVKSAAMLLCRANGETPHTLTDDELSALASRTAHETRLLS